jgi:hypothetical protein
MGRFSTKGTRHIRKVGSQLNVHTSLTQDPSHLLSFNLVCCAKEVSDLINHPVMSLLGTRVGGRYKCRDGHQVGLTETSCNQTICPNQDMGVYQKTRLGASSSCDSKFSTSDSSDNALLRTQVKLFSKT